MSIPTTTTGTNPTSPRPPADGTTAHAETIQLVRELSEDTTLTEHSLFQLADYLNENREARHTWPGNQLFQFLRSVFAGGGIGDAQIGATTEALAGVEREFSLLIAPSTNAEPEVPLKSVWIEPFTLPEFRFKTSIADQTGGNSFDVDLQSQTCSCGAWFGNRRGYKEAGDARRCCNHVAKAYLDVLTSGELNDYPRLFKEVVADITSRQSGLDHRLDWKLLRIKMRPFLVAYGSKIDWCQVYGPNDSAMIERYTIHRRELRWSYGRHPQCPATIAAYVRDRSDSK